MLKELQPNLRFHAALKHLYRAVLRTFHFEKHLLLEFNHELFKLIYFRICFLRIAPFG